MLFRSLPPLRRKIKVNTPAPFSYRGCPKRPVSLKSIKLIWICAIFLLIAGSIMLADYRIRPIMREVSMNEAKTICTKAINEAVSEVLESAGGAAVAVSVERNGSGSISSITTDPVSLGKLKSDIALKVIDSLSQHGSGDIGIPVGSLLNNQFLIGHGPKIPFRVSPTATAVVDMSGEFLSAGVNQTLHRLTLTVEVSANAILPGMCAPVYCKTTFPLSETVIVGEVPNSFLDFSPLK